MQPRYIFNEDFMADPSAHIFQGKVYIYPSHDINIGQAENDSGDHFMMRDYHVLRLDDIENGQAIDCGKVLDLDDIPWASKQLWDNDVMEKNGRYYMVFCAKDKSGIFRLGVASADHPDGPFAPEADPIRGSYSIDPCLFKDNDEQVYCIFGGIWGGQLQFYRNNELTENPVLPKGTEPCICPRIAKMTDDMLQFAEEPREIVILDAYGNRMLAEDVYHFFEGSWMIREDDKYILMYSTGDTHYMCYAVGDNPYGPFKYAGTLLDPVVGWTTHGSICTIHGKCYLFHHDSVPSGGVTWLRSLKMKEILL